MLSEIARYTVMSIDCVRQVGSTATSRGAWLLAKMPRVGGELGKLFRVR
jgi:hypothetical protein